MNSDIAPGHKSEFCGSLNSECIPIVNCAQYVERSSAVTNLSLGIHCDSFIWRKFIVQFFAWAEKRSREVSLAPKIRGVLKGKNVYANNIPHNNIVGWRLPVIFNLNEVVWGFENIDRPNLANQYIGAQLLFRSLTRVTQREVGDYPQANGRDGHGASKQGNPKSEQGYRVGRRSLPEGFADLTFGAGLIGGLGALLAFYWWGVRGGNRP